MSDSIDGQPLTLTNLSSGASVVLDGATATLPQRGVSAPIRLRSAVTRYPGNARPSTQVMGIEEGDIEFKGWWRDTWMSLEGGASELVTRVRRLVILQAYISLTWGENLVRRGYVKEFEPTWHANGAVEWRLTLQVSEADEAETIGMPFDAPVTTFGFWDILALIAYDAELLATMATELNNVAQATVGLGEAA